MGEWHRAGSKEAWRIRQAGEHVGRIWVEQQNMKSRGSGEFAGGGGGSGFLG